MSAILILGGTTEGYELAEKLETREGGLVISSLAGRTSSPRMPQGQVRIGGFGGVPGLIHYLTTHNIAAVIDATHPFARRMGWNAAQACADTHTPLVRLERPAWHPGPGDRWHSVQTWDQAVALVGQNSKRVLLAIGRQELAPFATLTEPFFLIRSVEQPDPMPPFVNAELLLARGPFTVEDERRLLKDNLIDTVVCKNSGGNATDAKLTAARELGVQVIMLDRPARPDVPTVASVGHAVTWLYGRGLINQGP